MRISTQQIFANGLNGITNASSEVSRTQEQIASGRRVTNPSDDPVASTRILSLETELNISEQYQKNIDSVEGRLQLSETHLSSMELAIQRIRELVIQAGDGALSNEDRSFLVLEIGQRLDELVSTANSSDAEGNYLFAGFSSNTTPFINRGDGFSYQGDEGLRYEQIGSGLQVAANLTGKELFTNIPIVNNEVLVSAVASNSSSVAVAVGRVVDQATYDAAHPASYNVTFNPLGNVIPAGPNYSIIDASSGQVLVADVAYAAGDDIAINGVEIALDGVPNPGDTFTVRGTNNLDLLTTVQRIANGLGSFSDADERSAFIGDALDNLDNIQASLSQGRSKIGARLNTLETARGTQQSLDLINTGLISELRDLDYAEAVSRLSFQTFVLEAAQSSFVRISNLSLFNFLR